jgi:hypothetical protein
LIWVLPVPTGKPWRNNKQTLNVNAKITREIHAICSWSRKCTLHSISRQIPQVASLGSIHHVPQKRSYPAITSTQLRKLYPIHQKLHSHT